MSPTSTGRAAMLEDGKAAIRGRVPKLRGRESRTSGALGDRSG